MKLHFGFIPICLTVAVVGCGHACHPSDVAGEYEARSGRGDYQLHLSPDGSGVISLNRNPVESLSWEFEPRSAQIFLRVSRDITDQLKVLAGEPKTWSGSVPWKTGYFGLTPVCGSAHQAVRLELSVDGEHYFSRTD